MRMCNPRRSAWNGKEIGMQDFEKLGVFYLGKEVEPQAAANENRLLL